MQRQVQVPPKCHRHNFLVCIERATKRHDRYLNHFGLKSLFQDRKQITIQSEKSTGFVNVTEQQYLKRQGVNSHTTHIADMRGAVIKRFNKSVKTSIFKDYRKTTHTVTWTS